MNRPQSGDRVFRDRVLVPVYRRPRSQQRPGVWLMSTATATTRTTPATSSWASSTKFKTFAITFAIVGPVIYMICLQMNWPLFTYHPATNRIAFGWEAARSGEGPNMTWYGWTAMTLPRRDCRELPRYLAPRKRDQKDSFDPGVAAADPGDPVFDL